VMVTGEASYAKVAEAAEAALDAYLVKPYTSAALADRLASARHRKVELKGIFDAIDAREFDRAADLRLERFQRKATYWLYAARIGAELLLRLARHTEARELYEAIIAARTVPWARLGVARTEVASGNLSAARRTLETLIGDMPDQADSYDLMGRVQMEQGEITDALRTYRTASNLTPGCLLRQQRAGTLAFYAGERDEALKQLERAMINGLRSKLFDMFTLVLIALMRFDQRDGKNLKLVHEAMLREIERAPKATRLQRFGTLIQGLRLLYERRVADALQLARDMSQELESEAFDLEAATLLLAFWIRFSGQEIQLEEIKDLITRIGLRYCTSKASTEVLIAMCEKQEMAMSELRECHARIFGIAETAMRHTMRGSARVGVELLIQQGEETRNAKLIDMAQAVLKRHAEKIEDAESLNLQIEALQKRFVLPLGVTISRRSVRQAGGLALRA